MNTEVPNPSELPEGSGPRRYMGVRRLKGVPLPASRVFAPKVLVMRPRSGCTSPPDTQALIWVEGLGQSEGKEINTVQRADIERVGWCEEVAYHAGYDQVLEDAHLRCHHGHAQALQNPHAVVQQQSAGALQTGAQGRERRGFWMRVRLPVRKRLGKTRGRHKPRCAVPSSTRRVLFFFCNTRKR